MLKNIITIGIFINGWYDIHQILLCEQKHMLRTKIGNMNMNSYVSVNMNMIMSEFANQNYVNEQNFEIGIFTSGYMLHK